MGSFQEAEQDLHAFVRPDLSLTGSFESINGNGKKGSGKIRSILDLVDFNAIHNPDHTFCLQESKKSFALRQITFRDLAQAVRACSTWLCQQKVVSPPGGLFGEGIVEPAAPVALLMASDIGIFIHLLALIRLGVPVALLSARLSPAAIAHLANKIKIKSILVTSHTSRAAKTAANIMSIESDSDQLINCFQAASFETLLEDSAALRENVPPPFHKVDELDRNTIILHSSGSTGLPKPIYQTHKYILSYAACHRFSADEDVSGTCTSTLPLFHGFGMLAPGLSLSIGKPFVLPSASTIPNADSIVRLLQSSNSTSLMTVPLILEEICNLPNREGIEALQPLDFVACGGGPMKASVAETLSAEGVRLLNHCGATEIGALAPIFNPGPGYDWHYFLVRDDLNLRFEEVPENPGCFKLIGRPPGWKVDYVVQDFLRPNPLAPTTQFQFLGRADDLIVLANGEKVRCTSLEAAIANDARVKDCIAFGEGRNHVGLIVEAASEFELDCSNGTQAAIFVDSIWPLVKRANEEIDSHGEVSRNMIIVASSLSRPLSRTSKGSLARKEIYDSFESEINGAYLKTAFATVDALPDPNDTYELSNYVRKAISDILGFSNEIEPVGDERDIFELGMNSLQGTRLLHHLVAAAQQRDETKNFEALLGRNFVYSHPNVSCQTKALQSIMQSGAKPNGGGDISRVAAMLETTNRHCKGIETMEITRYSHTDHTRESGDKIVVLTGSTGNLGSNIAYKLATDPTVAVVYCMNRRSSPSADPIDRQRRAFKKAGVCLPHHLWPKLKPVEADIQRPDFGLDLGVYQYLTQASYIIHNAWPMDFNRSLASFEAQFQYLGNIIKLALDGGNAKASRILFTSSIAAVARYTLRAKKVLVPEVQMDDPEVTAPFGYPEAKWVCEQILSRAASWHQGAFEPMIVRVGQLTGSTSGASWAPSEHLPSMFKSSQSLGVLPEISGTLSWIPVDVAASTVVEILFQPSTPTSAVYHLENPIRQSWFSMLATLSRILHPQVDDNTALWNKLPVIPFDEWLARVRSEPDTDRNPAARLIEFLEEDFETLGTGNLVLDTKRTLDVSESLRGVGEVDEGLVESYVRHWKAMRFL